MRRFPAYASFIKTVRMAVIGSLSDKGQHGRILAAIESGAQTIQDISDETKYSRSYIHDNLQQLISLGLVESRNEPKRGNFRPRKLFILTKNKGNPADK